MTGNADLRFVDTNILVYAHDLDASEKHERARALIHDLWLTGNGAISIQVLQEFFETVTRRIPSPLSTQEATEAVVDYSQWVLHSPSSSDIVDAIVIHERYDISFWDAMILNSSAKLGCELVYSEDLNAGQVIAGIRIENPFTLES